MNRKKLLTTLELTQPALSGTDIVPIFTHFMFEDGKVSASNDALSIIASSDEIATDGLKFAINGKTLLGLLNNSGSEEVTFEAGKEHDIIVKAGRSTFKLPFLTEEDFLFEEPLKEKWLATTKVSEITLEGIEICLNTTARDDSMRALMGVCFNFNGNLTLYSCDGDAITRYLANSTEAQIKGKGAYTIPNKFCEAMLKIADVTETKVGKIELSNAWVKASIGDFTLYGRMLENDAPLDHAALIKKTIPEKIKFTHIPEGFSAALSRAMVVADSESAPTTLSVQDDVLFLITETKTGDVNDEMKLEGHPDVEAKIHASLIQKSAGLCDQLALFENCSCYSRDDGVALIVISNIGE